MGEQARLARISSHLRPNPAGLSSPAPAGPFTSAHSAPEPPPAAGLSISTLTPEFGLRIEGLSAAASAADAALGRWLAAALYTHGVLVIPGQQALLRDPAAYSAFAGLFGPTYAWPHYADGRALIPGHADIMPLANIAAAAVPSDFDPKVARVLRWDAGARTLAVDWSAATAAADGFRNGPGTPGVVKRP
jgi:hypothetical protein